MVIDRRRRSKSTFEVFCVISPLNKKIIVVYNEIMQRILKLFNLVGAALFALVIMAIADKTAGFLPSPLYYNFHLLFSIAALCLYGVGVADLSLTKNLVPRVVISCLAISGYAAVVIFLFIMVHSSRNDHKNHATVIGCCMR